MKIRYVVLCFSPTNLSDSPDLVMGPYKRTQDAEKQGNKLKDMTFEVKPVIKPVKRKVVHQMTLAQLSDEELLAQVKKALEQPGVRLDGVLEDLERTPENQALFTEDIDYTPTLSSDTEPPVAPPGVVIEETLEEFMARNPEADVAPGTPVIVTRNKLSGQIEKVEAVKDWSNQRPAEEAKKHDALSDEFVKKTFEDDAVKVETSTAEKSSDEDISWDLVTDLVGSVTTEPEKAFETIFELASQIAPKVGELPMGTMDRILGKVREAVGSLDRDKIYVKEFGNNGLTGEFDPNEMYMISYESSGNFYIRGPFARGEALSRPRPDHSTNVKLYRLAEEELMMADTPQPQTVDS